MTVGRCKRMIRVGRKSVLVAGVPCEGLDADLGVAAPGAPAAGLVGVGDRSTYDSAISVEKNAQRGAQIGQRRADISHNSLRADLAEVFVSLVQQQAIEKGVRRVERQSGLNIGHCASRDRQAAARQSLAP